MDFELSAGQQQRFQEIVEFAGKEVHASVSDPDLRQAWRAFADFGLTGLPAPAKWGGAACGALDSALAIEALGYGCKDAGLVFSLCAHLFTCVVPIWIAGNEDQRRDSLLPLASGDWIGGNATSEPDHGSDVSSIQTTAELRGDRYVLNGHKCYSSNAPIADVLVVYATLDQSRGFSGITAFIVNCDSPGLEILPTTGRIGLRSSPTAELVLADCEVPVEQRLGAEGAGSIHFALSMRWERTCLFALYLGAMQRQLEECVTFAKQRVQFGQPIGKFQSISNRLVDMKLRLESSRLLLYRAACLLDQGKPCDLDVALSKLHVSESAVASGLDAIQIHGARGCLEEFGVEGALRDAIPARIFSGTSEIQRMIIARSMGL